MGHCNGTALCDLLLKSGNHGAVASQHIAKPNGHKIRRRLHSNGGQLLLFGLIADPVHTQEGQLVHSAFPDFFVKGLDDHFTQTLGGAHDVCGVDRLIRRDQHELFTAVHHRCKSRLICTNGVIFDGFAGTVLHQRNMLMCCCVINHIRTVGFEHLIDSSAVPDRTDQHFQIQLGVFIPQFQANGMGIIFINIENDQLLGIVLGDLSAKLAADRSAAARYQNDLALNEAVNLIHIYLDRLTTQQVLNGHILQGFGCDILVHHGICRRQIFQLAICFLANLQDFPALRHGCAGHCQKDFLNLIPFGTVQNLIPAAHNRNAIDKTTPFVPVVIDDAAYPFVAGLCIVQIPQEKLSRRTCANQHHPAGPSTLLGTHSLFPLQQDKAISETDGQHQRKLDKGTDKVVCHRHPFEQQRNTHRMGNGQDRRAKYDALCLYEAGKTPNASIQPQRQKHHNAQHRMNRHVFQPRSHIFCRDLTEFAVKAKPQRKKIRCHGHRQVKEH